MPLGQAHPIPSRPIPPFLHMWSNPVDIQPGMQGSHSQALPVPIPIIWECSSQSLGLGWWPCIFTYVCHCHVILAHLGLCVPAQGVVAMVTQDKPGTRHKAAEPELGLGGRRELPTTGAHPSHYTLCGHGL